MSAARYALLKLEESPPHVKNWRPQILLLSKCTKKTNQESAEYEIQHPNSFVFAGQLKAGKGLLVCANIVSGDFIQQSQDAKNCKKAIKNMMNKQKLKGFSESLVAKDVEQGLSHLIQTIGLGGLRHNTIIINWPTKWDREFQKGSMEEEEIETLGLSSFVRKLILIETNLYSAGMEHDRVNLHHFK